MVINCLLFQSTKMLQEKIYLIPVQKKYHNLFPLSSLRAFTIILYDFLKTLNLL